MKMKYYYANWTESNSFKYERKINKDCFDADKQTSMVNKLVDITTIHIPPEPEPEVESPMEVENMMRGCQVVKVHNCKSSVFITAFT